MTDHLKTERFGKCRVCGCTDATPCVDEMGRRCAWMDLEHTLCDNTQCIGATPLQVLEEMGCTIEEE